MNKALLVDINLSSMPIYNALINAGLEVYVIGRNKTDLLSQYAENFIEGDYSDLSFLDNVITTYRINYLIPGCNDLSYEVCSQMAAKHQFSNIDNVENTYIINNKKKLKDVLLSLDIPAPKIIQAHEVNNVKSVIVKPTDAFSGKGITILNEDNKEQLNATITHAKEFSKTNSFIIEEFVDGQLYSYSGFLENGVIIKDFIVQENGSSSNFSVDTSMVVFDMNPSIAEKIKNDIERLSEKLNLCNGLIHVQFILKNEKYWVIEITRRCPGDLYSLLIEEATGYKYAESYANAFISKNIISNSDIIKKNITRHTVCPTHPLKYQGLQFHQDIKFSKLFHLANMGDELNQGALGRTMIIFVESESGVTQEELYNTIINRKLYSYIN